MKQLTSKFMSASLLMMLMVFSLSMPASAIESESTINDTPSERQDSAKAKQAEARAKAAEMKAKQAEARAKVQEAKAEAKNDGKPGRTDEQKQKICNARKDNINLRIKRLTSSSQNAQKRIDSILAKAQNYHDTAKVDPADYDNLLETAQAAQTKSADSVKALADAVPTIDCSNNHAHDDVVNFQNQAKTTRTNLKAYRQSVKALLKSLHTAKTEGAQQ